MRLCVACGLNPVVDKSRCRRCYNEYMRVYMLKRYHKRRADAIEQLGGRCVVCASTESLEFDHIVASEKLYNVGKIFTSGSNKILATEVAKCQLLCVPHHLQKSLEMGDMRTVPHGGGVSGKRNCLCDPCKETRRQYMRKYKKGPVAETD